MPEFWADIKPAVIIYAIGLPVAIIVSILMSRRDAKRGSPVKEKQLGLIAIANIFWPLLLGMFILVGVVWLIKFLSIVAYKYAGPFVMRILNGPKPEPEENDPQPDPPEDPIQEIADGIPSPPVNEFSYPDGVTGSGSPGEYISNVSEGANPVEHDVYTQHAVLEEYLNTPVHNAHMPMEYKRPRAIGDIERRLDKAEQRLDRLERLEKRGEEHDTSEDPPRKLDL